MKQFFKKPAKDIRVLAISSMIMAGSIAAHAQVKVGANPANITTNAVLDVEGTSAQRTVILQNGNMGVNQAAPTNKLHVKDAADPVKIEGLQTSTNANDKSVLIDANGVLKSGTSISSTPGYSSVYQAIGTTELGLSENSSSATDIPGAFVTFTTTSASSKVLVTGIGYFVSQNPDNTIQGAMDIVVDGTKRTSGFFSGTDFKTTSHSLNRMPIPVTCQLVLTLPAGSHTIKLQARTWVYAAFVNRDGSTYGGAFSSDADALKSRISALVISQ